MSDRTRISIAAAITALFLAAISAAGLITHHAAVRQPTAALIQPASVAQSRPASTPSQVLITHDQEHD